jgi:hypothetical protein
MIGGGKKSNFGPGERCNCSPCRGRRGDGDIPSQQRVLLDLSNQAIVIGALSILVEKTVKLRRHRKGEGANPQHEHQTGDRKPAAPARTL